MIDPADLPELPRLLSEPRFARYRDHYAGRADLAIRLYAWNCEVTAAFWGPLACLEVVVRNAIHQALAAGRRGDWWNDSTVVLMDRERAAIDQAVRTLERRGVRHPTPDDVVAATSFGLWVGLTDAGLPRHPTLSYETALWQPRLVKAFPELGQVRRKQLHRELDEVRRFRNRLAHHEPIYNAPLARIRDDLLEIAGYVHPDAERLLAGANRIDAVLERKREVVSTGSAVI